MNPFRSKWSWLGALALCMAVGCAGRSIWPFGPVSDTVPGITPPPERMKKIREMAKQAHQQGPKAEASCAENLARMYPQEKDPLLRGEIARAAGELSCPEAVAVLRQAMKDSDADVRVLACRSLGKQGGNDASLALREALAGDMDADVRLAAAKALGRTGDPQAVPALGAALEDSDPAMQYRAVGALRQVAPEDVGNDVDRWREYVKRNAPASTVAADPRPKY